MQLKPPSSKSRVFTNFVLFDVFWLIVSPFLALWLREPSLLDVGQPYVFLYPVYIFAILTIITSLLIFIFYRVEQNLTHYASVRDAIDILFASFFSVLASVFVVFSFSRLDGIPRSVPIIYGLVLVVGLMSYRLIIRKIYEYRFNLQNQIIENIEFSDIRRILIVGLDHFAISAIRLINSQRPRAIQIVAAFSFLGQYGGRTVSSVRIIGSLSEIGSVIDEYKIHGIIIDEVWVSDSSNFFSDSVFTLVTRECLSRNIVAKKLSEALNLCKPRSHADRTSVDQTK